jgi:hypothetical protein
MMAFNLRFTFLVLMMLCLSTYAQAVRITSVSVSKDPVSYQSDFEVTAKLDGETCNLIAEFYVDNYRFDFKNVGCEANSISGKFKLSAEDWEYRQIKCGVRVANRSERFNIGYIPNVRFTPSEPTEGRETTVKLTDDNGNALPNIDTLIKDVYGGDPLPKKSVLDGTFSFIPKVAGEYKMSFLEKDVCGEITFYAKRPIMVDGPRPDNPVVNEMMVMGVPAGASVGVKILDAEGNLYKTVPVTYSGGVNFSISDAGTYTVIVCDQSTKYWGLNKTITVSDRLAPEIKIAPEQPIVGRVATLTVTSRGQPLAGAIVTVKKPDGVDRDFTATDYGTVNYDQITSTGTYQVKTTKDRYSVGTSSFEAKHSFDVRFEPQNPTVKDTLTMTVRDQNEKPVGDVMVEIPAIGFKRVTDLGGRVSFNLQEPKEYQIRLSKDLFWDNEVDFTPYGLLSIGECVQEFEVGGNIVISVFDSFKQPISADITFKDPDGIIRSYSASAQTYTPDKPGQYVATVSRTNYIPANLTFKVLPHPLDASTSMKSGQLMVNVTSAGKNVPNIKVSVKKAGVVFNGTTNDAGQVWFNLYKEGNVTVSLNPGRDNIMYVERAMNQNIIRSYGLIFLFTPLILIGAITVVTIIAIQLGRKYLGSEWKMPSLGLGGKAPKTKHDSVLLGGSKPQKSRLSKL